MSDSPVPSHLFVVQSYFDGERYHNDGPYTIAVKNGRIAGISGADPGAAPPCRAPPQKGLGATVVKAPFVMPGLVEGHCHLFLEGGELDLAKRKAYLDESLDVMIAMGRRNLERQLASGVTLVRDAGDAFGVNTRLAAELDAASTDPVARPALIRAGRGLRKTGRYGAFMAVEAADEDAIVRVLREIAPEADQIKLVLTGIIDLEKGRMKGGAQFSLAEMQLIIRTVRELGKRSFAHCSGPEGLRIAVEAGIDSIEHGYFAEPDTLEAMAAKSISWVPTFAPVHFQQVHSGSGGATADVLRRVLDDHGKNLTLAARLGVPIVAGSDAGSYGVPHGTGLIDELLLMRRTGLSMEQVLSAATSVPRRLWGCEPSGISVGHRANLVTMARSPFDDELGLREVTGAMVGPRWRELGDPH